MARWIALSFLLVVASLALPSVSHGATQRGKVVRVVDGDTVVVRVAGIKRTYDLLGVQAPASGACYASDSRAGLKALLPVGVRVRLARDPARPGKGRYVTKGVKFVNAATLRAGRGRASNLDGLSRASALSSAASSAEQSRRGLFGACTDPAGPGDPGPAAPGPIENANAVRAALVGRQLVEFTSTARSSTRTTTRFCQGARSDRSEDFTGEIGAFRNDYTGSWEVFAVARGADGTLTAGLGFQPDDPSVDHRRLDITVAPDGTVRSTGANASELQQGGACSPAQIFAGDENNTPGARNGVLQSLVGKRLTDGSVTTDFCSASRAIRREGATVVDGSWAVEWANSNASSYFATVAIKGTSASRRSLVLFAQGQPFQVRDLGRLDDDAHQVQTSAAVC